MKYAFLFLLIAVSFRCTRHNETKAIAPTENATTKPVVGGGCDGCEIMYVGMPSDIKPVDTSAGWNEKGKKLLVKGTVFKHDGTTPAPNVIIYYWQTDNNGLYAPKPGMDEKSARHGHIRGWMKTGSDGKFALYTIRPASYPNTDNPQHIHISVKEPDLNEYYIDEWNFDDDLLVTEAYRNRLENRGGSGILKARTINGLLTAEQNIYLGKNIPGYPKQ